MLQSVQLEEYRGSSNPNLEMREDDPDFPLSTGDWDI